MRQGGPQAWSLLHIDPVTQDLGLLPSETIIVSHTICGECDTTLVIFLPLLGVNSSHNFAL